MNKPCLASILTAAMLLPAGAALGLGNWGGVFPPLTEADVAALGGAADSLEETSGDAADTIVSWENDASGTHGTVQVLKRFERADRPCRRYRLFIAVQGFEPYNADPVMCKADDGKWKFVN